MNVNDAGREEVDGSLGDDFAIASKYTGDGRYGLDIFGDFFEFGGLPDGNIVLPSEGFDGWRNEFLAAAFFAVGFRNDGCNNVACRNETL